MEHRAGEIGAGKVGAAEVAPFERDFGKRAFRAGLGLAGEELGLAVGKRQSRQQGKSER